MEEAAARPYSERVVCKLLEERARLEDDREFLRFAGGRPLTYGELDALANRTASGLAGIGVAPGDKVGVMLPNCQEFIATWFALAKSGAPMVPINTSLKGRLLEYILDDADITTLVVDRECLEVIEEVATRAKKLRRLIVRDPEPASTSIPEKLFGIQSFPYSCLADHDAAAPNIPVQPRDLALVVYTSGTTGPSKGVMISHHFYYWRSVITAREIGYSADDVLFTCMPLFHMNAHDITLTPALLVNARVVIHPRFSASTFWDEIRDAGATCCALVGTMGNILFRRPEQENDADNKLRLATCSPLPVDYEAFERRFGLRLISPYGSTEAGMVSIYKPELAPARETGCIGLPVENFETMVVDENDHEVAAGERGELIVRNKEPLTLFSAYYGKPQETLKNLSNLWFHTGDSVWRDEQGYLYFADRIKDAIRRRGENVSSFEVESAVNEHPSVQECAALAVPSELGEDDVKIVVVLCEGEQLEPAALIGFLSARLPYFAVPRYVEFRDQLPKTPTGRVEKYKLRQEWLTSMTWDRQKSGAEGGSKG